MEDYRLMFADGEALLRCDYRDEFEVRLRIPAEEVRRAQLGSEPRFLSLIDSKVDDALRVLRYAHRKVPRLGAGTHGYKGRR